ncbi:MAG: tRNA uridine-5-carboxymethylaminomethyl(34) synthesis enzyme MnmG [Deltaproteobacteria bacterium]|nr:tRNA uridine-5-carboxymethylaminomethyl(34) synthesis enzyme MnmG [Deltaproteobacteria bacterium]
MQMFDHPVKYDVIVVGGGHAGYEAAHAAAKMGCRTLLTTIQLDTIGLMSCNPAIGGLAKGQLVKEIDALGGIMGEATDATAIQFRILNTRKGPAVRSSRSQSDRQRFRLWIKNKLESMPGLDIKQALIENILVEGGATAGVVSSIGERFLGRTVIIATGTFLNGLVHIGLTRFGAGRLGELPAVALSESLRALGLQTGRLKTGTTPRLDARTINFDVLEPQYGDDPPQPFSFNASRQPRSQIPCHITYTNEATHAIIREGFDRSPLYTGIIQGTGARYCPSIEDKIKRFPDKERHQIFLEPEGFDTVEIYPSGIPTSLPIDIQYRMVRSIRGLEQAEIMRPGYAIEYDYVNPVQLRPTLETRQVAGLFLAGQINGTSGYEEAGAQGLMAGINAACRVKGLPPLVLKRSEAYIGVLIDDLVTHGTLEPYRMFTSRAEYRLLLREDNADARLREKGYRLGLVGACDLERLQAKLTAVEQELERLCSVRVAPQADLQQWLERCKSAPLRQPCSLLDLLKRPEIDYEALVHGGLGDPGLDPDVRQQVETFTKYEGYIQRQQQLVEKFRHLEDWAIPPDMCYDGIAGLSAEVSIKLTQVRPVSLGQASRIAGITPAAISILMVHLKKRQAGRQD